MVKGSTLTAIAPATAATVGQAATGSRHERRKAETRRRLLAAARELFARRGYDATRPQDIARAADVAAGTFYLHFADKRAAFLAFTDHAAQELMGRIREHARDTRSFEQRLYASLEAVFEYADANPGVLTAAFADAAVISAGLPAGTSLRDRLARSLSEGLRQGMASGSVANDYDPLVIAHGIVGMIQAACVHAASDTRPRDLLENLTRFCARALDASQETPA
jgi:AcrR family transcriptional regulator